MSVRVEVLADGSIELLRHREGVNKFIKYSNLESAMIVIKMFVKQDLAQAASDKFEPQIIKDARKAFKQLQEKSPYGQR
jgi:energy-converting hydrogenase Eha subunit C